ncbi:MAG: PAS domain-containing protein [Anaerolineae bacterium]|nr:PAS domain-containing protein [Anaerolineae bacterium]
MGAIESLLNLFSGGGALVYHLLILLALEAAAGISVVEYRHTKNPDQRRLLHVFFALIVLRIPLLLGDSLQGILLLPPFLFVLLALFEYALEVISLTLLWWAFLAPLINRRWGRTLVIGNLVLAGLAALAFFPNWFQAVLQLPPLIYQEVDLSLYAFSLQVVWDVWATLIPLSALVLLLLHRKRLGYDLPAVSFALIALGNGLIAFNQIGLGRLVNLMGYPLLAVTVYRIALQDMWAYRRELETLSEESLRQTRELLFLVEISRAIGESLDLDTVLQRVVEGVAHAVNTDQAAILLVQEGAENHVRMAAQYNPLSFSRRRLAASILAEQLPNLTQALQERQQFVFNTPENYGPLLPIYNLLDSAEAGPTIIQPLTRQERALGALIVGNDHSKRPFGSNEARLCSSIAAQVSAAIDNARLHRHLSRSLKIQEEEVGRREAILESIAEGVIVTNVEGRAVLMNVTAEKLLGASRDRILGRPLQQFLEPAVRDQSVDLSELARSSTPLQILFELEGRQIHINAAPVHTHSGEQLGMVAVMRDVTLEVQSERAKREFIATISHELRTPLTAILGYTEALSSGMAGSLDDMQKRFIAIIHDNSQNMISMANNLIALSAAERGRLELEYAQVDLAQLIPQVMRPFLSEMESQQLEFHLAVEPNVPPIEADPAFVEQIIANLVSNAIRFTFPGGSITVGASAEPDPGEEAPTFCKIWVQDTGVGIAPEAQPLIWERFYRADNPLKIEAGGLGVGLFIVKALVKAHGGIAWVESGPGEGAKFTVRLPIQRPSSFPQPPSPSPAEIARGTAE